MKINKENINPLNFLNKEDYFIIKNLGLPLDFQK